MRVKCHPTLGILVGTDGHVMVPASGARKARWTFGCKDGHGYLVVRINGKTYKVHRLVAETFLPNPENKPFIDHLNRNREDNRVSPACKCNLRWVTYSENNRNTPRHDRVDSRNGTHWYEDEKQYQREYYLTHKQSYRGKVPRQSKTHKYIRFSDGHRHWLPNELAPALLKLPVKERTWPI